MAINRQPDRLTTTRGAERAAPGSSGPLQRTSPRQLLLRTISGRVFIAAVAAKLLFTLLRQLGAAGAWLDVVETAASLAIIWAIGSFIVKLLVLVKQRLLWRVRRKLILSYIFVGFVPALLILAFFLFAGMLMFRNISSYLFRDGFDDLVEDARLIADNAALEIQKGSGAAGAAEVLERKRDSAARRYPGISLALVPTKPAKRGQPSARVASGPWGHLDPPASLPSWVLDTRGFAGALALSAADEPQTTVLVIRAAGLPESPDPSFGVVVDIPVDDTVRQRLFETTGIQPGTISVMPLGGEVVRPTPSRIRRAARAVVQTPGDWRTRLENWVAFVDYTDWDTGRKGNASIAVRVGIADIYQRLAVAQPRLVGMRLGDLFLLVLVVIAGLFLIIEFVALVMGFALAKSITGSVHELFMGTERIRQGDFAHRIRVRTKDQLGELADQFNQMTESIEELLRQQAEKKRLEEELRIARQIQMSLLPRGMLSMPGLAVTALCVPAREVGGDYYDFFQLGEHRIGLLIADVSGKGTSAALYMAELKGLMLSLSETHHSPKRLLIEVNRIISDNLDSRSFITMTYAVLDLMERTLVYARAGHTPLIYVPGESATGRREAQVLAPGGLVLGLRIDGVQEKFEQLLEERTLTVGAGDVVVLFTDGVTEAMNQESDLFGESRLSSLIEEHGHLPSDELRERILREIEAFVAGADQHDDLTIILLKIEKMPENLRVRPLEMTGAVAVGE
jgi:sigma-B regulation protein RsbU (phosphoserine phosphatase)